MDSAALLDLLGNENRRRILRLLARKPCYVTEISEYLGVSPKAVIDHLRKLDEAGLVESRTDDQRRKYFSIARNLRLEVNVSPYGFGTKSAYPASRNFDMTRCRHLSIECSTPDDSASLDELARELDRLETLSSELSMAQRWVQGRVTEVMDDITDRIADSGVVGDGDARFYSEIIAAIADGADRIEQISRRVDAAPEAIEKGLIRLADAGVVETDSGRWYLRTADPSRSRSSTST